MNKRYIITEARSGGMGGGGLSKEDVFKISWFYFFTVDFVTVVSGSCACTVSSGGIASIPT